MEKLRDAVLMEKKAENRSLWYSCGKGMRAGRLPRCLEISPTRSCTTDDLFRECRRESGDLPLWSSPMMSNSVRPHFFYLLTHHQMTKAPSRLWKSLGFSLDTEVYFENGEIAQWFRGIGGILRHPPSLTYTTLPHLSGRGLGLHQY